MDTMLAFALGEVNRGKEMKVFDWDKAAQIIKEKNPEYAEAGLFEDLEYTCGLIYKNEKPVYDSYTYLASTWATPVLICDDEIMECWIMESQTKYKKNTKWSESSLKILRGEQNDR